MNQQDLDTLYDIIASLEAWQNSASVKAALAEKAVSSPVNKVKSDLLRYADQLS